MMSIIGTTLGEMSSLSLAFIVSRASGQSAQILAKAKSPLESFVPPLFTWLKMSTTEYE